MRNVGDKIGALARRGAGSRRGWRTYLPMALVLATALIGWLLFKDGPTAVPQKASVAASAPAAKSADVKLEAAAPAGKPDAPATAEVPKAEVPKAEAPKAAAPKLETPKTETKVEVKPAEAAPVAVAALPPGVTTFFGSTPTSAEMPARLNPDYKQAVAAAVAPPSAPAPVAAEVLPVAPPPPGVTSFYGSQPSPGEATALANPDYKPAAPVVVAEAAAAPTVAVEPATPAATPTPGVTSFYGVTPPVVEAPALPNPDYKPAAPVVVAEAIQPVAPAPAPAAAPVVEAPKPAPGVTSFYGSTPAPAEAPAVANPDYKPAASAAVAPAAKPVEVAPAPAKPVAIASCQDGVSRAVKSGPILFDNAKATLTQASTETLDRVAAAFRSCPEARLQVDGHTDSSGAPERNQALSERRAEAVVEYLTSKGVVPGLVAAAGYGETKPVAPNDTPANMALNRRIEFTVGKK